MSTDRSIEPPSTSSPAQSVMDLGFQTAYKVAHRMLRAYWFVRRPQTHGALVAMWNRGELMLVKNSYRHHYTLPGGYIESRETAVQAAARELSEEVNIKIDPQQMAEAYDGIHLFEFRHDRVTIVEFEVKQRPHFAVDNREVVWAGFVAPDEVLRMPVVPHVVDYLRERGH